MEQKLASELLFNEPIKQGGQLGQTRRVPIVATWIIWLMNNAVYIPMPTLQLLLNY